MIIIVFDIGMFVVLAMLFYKFKEKAAIFLAGYNLTSMEERKNTMNQNFVFIQQAF